MGPAGRHLCNMTRAKNINNTRPFISPRGIETTERCRRQGIEPDRRIRSSGCFCDHDWPMEPGARIDQGKLGKGVTGRAPGAKAVVGWPRRPQGRRTGAGPEPRAQGKRHGARSPQS